MAKDGHAKHEIGVCCPQHGALNPFRAVGELSAVTITVSEPFLQPTAEICAQSWQQFLAPRSYTNIYRRTTTTIALEPQHGALNPFSVGLHVARTGFKS